MRRIDLMIKKFFCPDVSKKVYQIEIIKFGKNYFDFGKNYVDFEIRVATKTIIKHFLVFILVGISFFIIGLLGIPFLFGVVVWVFLFINFLKK